MGKMRRIVQVIYEYSLFGSPVRHSWYFATWNWDTDLLHVLDSRSEVEYRIIDIRPADSE